MAEIQLEKNFDVEVPNLVWVTDITYIRTHEGCLYLAVVLNLFSRQVIGWSISSRIDAKLAINALLEAVWRRTPKTPVIVYFSKAGSIPLVLAEQKVCQKNCFVTHA